MVLIRDNSQRIDWLISQLSICLSIKDLGFFLHFLGIEFHQCGTNLFLSQYRYILNLLTQTKMNERKPLSTTPMPSKPNLFASINLFHDPTTYCSIVVGSQYLTFTRPDVSFRVNYVYQFKQEPKITNF